MMTRRSLNTFMNAFTGADWTAYPFATQNRQDFDNLLRVYLDAVFFPLIEELDFAQEGHRVEFEVLDDPSTPLVYKGVVFNEMKGAMSNPLQTLAQTLDTYLFPTTTYRYNSGGDPQAIPDLTYEQLKAFHARHYHPSNAIFMTYGDMPATEHQARMEEYALQQFSHPPLFSLEKGGLREDVRVPDEQRYTQPVSAEGHYALDADEDTADKTHIVLGWLLGKSFEPREAMEARLLAGVLLDNSASPLRHALETSPLGSAPSQLCGLDDSSREATFVCGLEGSNPEHAQAVEDLVLNVLRDIAENGVPREQVEAVLHQIELAQREITGGQFPYGLQLMVKALTPALHGGDPVGVLAIDPVLEALRRDIEDPAFIQDRVRRWLLDNPHRVRLTLTPDPTLSARRAEAEGQRLAQIKARLDDEAKARIVARAVELQARQLAEPNAEILPKVGLADVPVELKIASGEALDLGIPISWYGQGTNGMVYEQVIAALPQLPEDLLDTLPLYTACLTEVGCGGRDYLETQAWQAAVTGGVSARYSVRGEVQDVQRVRGLFVLAGKALVRNHAALAELLQQTYERPRFDELPRLRELVAQLRAHEETVVTDQGHALAMSAASAGLSPSAALSHRWSGLLGIKHLKTLDDALDDEVQLVALAQRFSRIHQLLLKAPRQYLAVGENAHREAILQAMQARWDGSAIPDGGVASFSPVPAAFTAREAWATSTQVNFCAKAYATVAANHPDAAALTVLGDFLRNGFLHRAIREQGGAYGAGAGYSSDTGAFRFYSYRDPRLAETLEAFDQSVRWLLDNDHPPQAFEEAILGVISRIDRPESPAGEAISAFFETLHGRTPEQRRQFRERVLRITLEDLKRVGAAYLVPERASIAVVSDARTLNESSGLSLELRHL
jgi:Zn-dependent M16 (insulinase) family peptidase